MSLTGVVPPIRCDHCGVLTAIWRSVQCSDADGHRAAGDVIVSVLCNMDTDVGTKCARLAGHHGDHRPLMP